MKHSLLSRLATLNLLLVLSFLLPMAEPLNTIAAKTGEDVEASDRFTFGHGEALEKQLNQAAAVVADWFVALLSPGR